MTEEPTTAATATTGISRRTFIRAVGAAGLGFALWGRLPSGELRAIAAIPGGTLDVVDLPKFVTPLTIPPAMPHNGTPDVYDVAVAQFRQQILPDGYPDTTVWSYGPTADLGADNAPNPGGNAFNYPAFTIEATTGVPVTVTWRNRLVDEDGNYLPHLLPVDPTLHWANPPGGEMHRDTRPTFTSTPPAYTGPVPIVTHVHGM
jgi:FtsP/CotA-like multicopper oxidase with cupredoxin domain